jgi:hypothetical protein
MPNGTVIIEELEKLAKETENDAGYKRVGDSAYCKRKYVHHKRSLAILCR